MTSATDSQPPEKSAMGFTCNIDRSGRRARAAAGFALLAMALGAFVGAALTAGTVRTALVIAGVSLVIGGAFCLFEAANSWCAIRAMGFRTRL